MLKDKRIFWNIHDNLIDEHVHHVIMAVLKREDADPHIHTKVLLCVINIVEVEEGDTLFLISTIKVTLYGNHINWILGQVVHDDRNSLGVLRLKICIL